MSEPLSNLPELSVSDLSAAIKRQIEDGFSYVRVRGELGRVSRPRSGHLYMDLKDDKAVLAGVMWKGVAAGLAIQPEEGMEVVATGKLTTFPGQSKYQIVIDSLAPAGVGALMALLEERKKKLAAEGLFAEERKKALPFLPRHIGVITSPTGAVIRDLLHRLEDRFPTRVTVWPVRVQGETSSKEVAAAIRGFNTFEQDGEFPRPDLLIVARGGGSLEDLWGFNEEIVARAASESAIPLISAVGHETDWTLIDLVADWRAPTPTAAAERAVPVRHDLVATVEALKGRLDLSVARGLSDRRERVRALGRGLPSLEALLSLPRQRLDGMAEKLEARFHQNLSRVRLSYFQTSGRLQPRLLSLGVERARARLHDLKGRQVTALASTTSRARNRFAATSLRPALLSPGLRQGQERLKSLGERSHRAFAVFVRQKGEALQGRKKLLSSLGYKSVLSRGYALVRNSANDAPLLSAAAISNGMHLAIEFADGTVSAVAGGQDLQTVLAKAKSPEAKKPKPKQDDLFS